jgi:methyltransferase
MHIAAAVLLVLLIVQRLAELAHAKRNARLAFARGGREYGISHYPLIVALHIAWFIAWTSEHVLRGGELLHPWWLFAGVIVLAQIMRYWTISTLGPAWNTRIIVVPGAERISKGPFRWLSHPNYVVVLVEFFFIPLFAGAYITAFVATAINYLVLTKIRIPAEEHALEELRLMSSRR